MSDSTNELNTPKFKNLRDEPSEYLKELSVLMNKHGLEIAIKQIKRSDIAVSRNREQRYEKLFNDTLELLIRTFPGKYKLIKRFKIESKLIKQTYQYIFNQVPEISDKSLFVKEKASFLIFLENYLIVNRHLEIYTSDRIHNYLVNPDINVNKIDKDNLNQLSNYGHYIDEQTRELRDILFYFNKFNTESFDNLEFSASEINEFRKYISWINDFWHFNHIHELWTYLDMPINIKNNILSINLANKKTYKSWMISNYRSRNNFNWMMHKYSYKIKNSLNKSTTDKLDSKNINHILCLEYFFALPSEVSINHVTIDTWILAYENLINFAKLFIKNLSNKNMRIFLKDWLCINSKESWIEIISNDRIDKKVAADIFSSWVLNSDKKNNGDIFDHPFYKINKNEYLLFSSIASQLAPIQCLLSLAKRKEEVILTKNNHFENEVEVGLQEAQIKYARNIQVEKIDAVVNSSNRKGEFDFVFEIEGTLFFIECKRFIQPFYFRDFQVLYEKIHAGCYKLKKNVNHTIKNKYMFDRTNSKILELFPESWMKKKRIVKVVLTSCCLGEYLFLHDCHVLDISVFNAWLRNSEIILRDANTMKKVEVIFSKKQGNLLDRFELLIREIDQIKLKKQQCTMKKIIKIIGGLQVQFPMYEEGNQLCLKNIS